MKFWEQNFGLNQILSTMFFITISYISRLVFRENSEQIYFIYSFSLYRDTRSESKVQWKLWKSTSAGKVPRLEKFLWWKSSSIGKVPLLEKSFFLQRRRDLRKELREIWDPTSWQFFWKNFCLAWGLNPGPLKLLRRALPYQPNGSLVKSSFEMNIYLRNQAIRKQKFAQTGNWTQVCRLTVWCAIH